jgi:hypothetical protein
VEPCRDPLVGDQEEIDLAEVPFAGDLRRDVLLDVAGEQELLAVRLEQVDDR